MVVGAESGVSQGAGSGSEQTVPCISPDGPLRRQLQPLVLAAAYDGVGGSPVYRKVLLGSVSKCCRCVPLVAR